jgi:hypothetical protein
MTYIKQNQYYNHSSEYFLSKQTLTENISDNISQCHLNSITIMMLVYQYHFLDGDSDLEITG